MVPSLVAEATGIGGQRIAVDPHQGEGVGGVGDEILGELLRPLGHEAAIGAVNEDHRDARVGPAPDQALDLAGPHRGQGRLTAWSRARRRGGS